MVVMEPGEEKWTEKLAVVRTPWLTYPPHARSPPAGEAGDLLHGQLAVSIKSFRKTNE